MNFNVNYTPIISMALLSEVNTTDIHRIQWIRMFTFWCCQRTSLRCSQTFFAMDDFTRDVCRNECTSIGCEEKKSDLKEHSDGIYT